jgi:hypothetical protein
LRDRWQRRRRRPARGEEFARPPGACEEKFARYRPARSATPAELAGMIMSLIEGGFILSRTYNDTALVARQSKQFRQYLEWLFADRKPAE